MEIDYKQLKKAVEDANKSGLLDPPIVIKIGKSKDALADEFHQRIREAIKADEEKANEALEAYPEAIEVFNSIDEQKAAEGEGEAGEGEAGEGSEGETGEGEGDSGAEEETTNKQPEKKKEKTPMKKAVAEKKVEKKPEPKKAAPKAEKKAAPKKEKKEVKRDKYGFAEGSQAASIMKMLEKGGTMEAIAEAVGTTPSRVRNHIQFCRAKKSLTINVKEGVFKLAK